MARLSTSMDRGRLSTERLTWDPILVAIQPTESTNLVVIHSFIATGHLPTGTFIATG
jgi:hypothetical protein